MRLRIVTPLAVVIDEAALSVRAEDTSGSFGILPGHADFLTSLALSVVEWTRADSTRHYCAVRRGMCSVSGGADIAVATREAVPSDDLAALGGTVLARFHADIERDRSERFESTQLQLDAIRRIVGQFGQRASGGTLFS